MIRVIKFLLTGDWHLHVWVEYGNVTRWFHEDDTNQLPTKRTQPFKCKICGKIKKVEV